MIEKTLAELQQQVRIRPRYGNFIGGAWVAPVKRGRMLYEMEGVDPTVAREALRLAAHKLPIQTRFVQREE